MAKELLIVSDVSGNRYRECYPIVPNRWQGEKDCVVGPFSGRDVARYFSDVVANFNREPRIFAQRDAWYVEVSGYVEVSDGGSASTQRYALSDQ